MVGVLEGLHRVGWSHVPVLAMETQGTNSLNAAVKAGHPVTLTSEIKSIAKSLGARTIMEEALDWTKRHEIISEVVSDKDAVSACLGFADDQKSLVEPACGAALAACYGDTITDLYESGRIKELDTVVVVVCGGIAVTLENLEMWRKQFDL